VLNDDDKLSFAVSKGKGAYLIGALLLALACTGGVFAFGFINTTTSLSASVKNSNFADVTVASGAPASWNVVGFTKGAIGAGSLFDIKPSPDYNGDLLVKIYLTNTAELLKAYQYLNMKVYMANSLEAEKTPDYQVLSIETGVVLFNIEGGSAEVYTVEITGGSYRLISDDPEEWEAGWNIVPEFYCEVGQR